MKCDRADLIGGDIVSVEFADHNILILYRRQRSRKGRSTTSADGLRLDISCANMQPKGCVIQRSLFMPTPESTTDRIVKQVLLKAPVDRVWRALSDYREFSQWFCVNLDQPFETGKTNRGQLTYPGYEHLTMELAVHKMEKEKLFSYHWHPYAVDPSKDYSSEPPTLVEFILESQDGGTLLTVIESGFDALPTERRDEAWRMNDGGWTEQVANIETYVNQESRESNPAVS